MAYKKSEVVPPTGTQLAEKDKPAVWTVESVAYGLPTKLRLKSDAETRSVNFNPPSFWQSWDVVETAAPQAEAKNVFGHLWNELESNLRSIKAVNGIPMPVEALPIAFRLAELNRIPEQSVMITEDLHGLAASVADLRDEDFDPSYVDLWKENASQVLKELARVR
ncbi:hypothetical protein EON82_12435 [bacterium]|nr:MAG: hypothetical protein EON82_12435 [bacterium]